MIKKKLIIVIMTGFIIFYIVIANAYEIVKLEWITLIEHEQKRCSNYITLPSGWSENTNYTINTTKDLEIILLDSYKGEIKVIEKVVVEGGRPCIFFLTKESVKEDAEVIFEDMNGETIRYKLITFGKTYYLVRSKY